MNATKVTEQFIWRVVMEPGLRTPNLTQHSNKGGGRGKSVTGCL